MPALLRRHAPAALLLAACLAACAPAAAPPADASAPEAAPEAAAPIVADPALANGAKAGTYTLDKHHASLVFAADHLGFSDYVGQFTRFEVTLTLDPAAPEAATVSAKIDPTSLTIPTPPEGFLQELLGPQWLNTAAFPDILFESTSVVLTSSSTATVTGDLTFLGTAAPVSFEARFNGAYPGMETFDPNSRAGFHAEGTLSRSAFGMVYGLPPEGSNMGVGDTVKFWIDAEFTGPALEAAPQ